MRTGPHRAGPDDRLSRRVTVARQPSRAGSTVRYVVVGRARDYRCRAERGVLRVRWPMACTAAGALLTLDVGCTLKVIETGRDERTLLRFSRISIARRADLVRSSASAGGSSVTVSPPCYGSAF
jgi:hypothetical protein